MKYVKTGVENSACMFMKIQLNLEGKRRQLKHRKVDAAIEIKAMKKYEENDNIRACLCTPSYLQKLDLANIMKTSIIHYEK